MSYPKYRVDKEKDGRFAVRKFTGFDHMWAEYSKPLEYFDTREEAEDWLIELRSQAKTSSSVRKPKKDTTRESE